MSRWTKTIRTLFYSLLLVALLCFIEYRRQQRVCQRVIIDIAQVDEHHFINQQDIHRLITRGETSQLVGTQLSAVDLKALEDVVGAHHYVKEANVYYDLKGNITVEATQNRPIARILRDQGPDAYLGGDGQYLPLSDRYTARVLLISGTYVPTLMQTTIERDTLGTKILKLVQFIEQDEFLRAQIAQIDIDRQGEVTLYPQVGKQQIAFGQPENISEKFYKLALFYEQILPRKGWNAYKKVNLTYQNQIVCD